MGITTSPPKYPCINPDPGFKDVTRNFRQSDYNIIAISTILSAPFGYFAGTSRLPQMRKPSVYMATLIGLCGGFAIAYQQAGGRLMGLLPNEEEVREARR